MTRSAMMALVLSLAFARVANTAAPERTPQAPTPPASETPAAPVQVLRIRAATIVVSDAPRVVDWYQKAFDYRIVEQGRVDDILDRPAHPYTIGLLDSVPANVERGERLRAIRGMAPNPLQRPSGCPFRTRCARASERCTDEPPLVEEGGRSVRCHHPGPTRNAA